MEYRRGRITSESVRSSAPPNDLELSCEAAQRLRLLQFWVRRQLGTRDRATSPPEPSFQNDDQSAATAACGQHPQTSAAFETGHSCFEPIVGSEPHSDRIPDPPALAAARSAPREPAPAQRIDPPAGSLDSSFGHPYFGGRPKLLFRDPTTGRLRGATRDMYNGPAKGY